MKSNLHWNKKSYATLCMTIWAGKKINELQDRTRGR